MATKHQKFQLNLSGYSAAEREAIALEVIDKITKRTLQGKDKNGEAFAKYSKAYTDSINFKIAGKSKSQVNLKLSGDMLDSIKILKNSTKVEIGFEKGSTENGKADGNIRGTYGQSSPVGPERDFLGISDRELQLILRKYPRDTERAKERARARLLEEETADRLSGRIDLQELEES